MGEKENPRTQRKEDLNLPSHRIGIIPEEPFTSVKVAGSDSSDSLLLGTAAVLGKQFQPVTQALVSPGLQRPYHQELS